MIANCQTIHILLLIFCIVTEVVLFLIFASKTLIFHKVV